MERINEEERRQQEGRKEDGKKGEGEKQLRVKRRGGHGNNDVREERGREEERERKGGRG